MPMPIQVPNPIHQDDDEIPAGGDSKGQGHEDHEDNGDHEDFHDANDGQDQDQDQDDHFDNVTIR